MEGLEQMEEVAPLMVSSSCNNCNEKWIDEMFQTIQHKDILTHFHCNEHYKMAFHKPFQCYIHHRRLLRSSSMAPHP